MKMNVCQYVILKKLTRSRNQVINVRLCSSCNHFLDLALRGNLAFKYVMCSLIKLFGINKPTECKQTTLKY